MKLVYKLRQFLEKKFKETGLTKKVFAKNINIHYTTVLNITKGVISNPDLYNIVKIADYFNCSVDEVLGRTKYASNISDHVYNSVTTAVIKNNLLNFLQNQNIDLYRLSSELGFSHTTLPKFVQSNEEHRSLRISMIVLLADHFNVSIDEMIGRYDKI